MIFDINTAISTKLYHREKFVNSYWWKSIDFVAFALLALWVVIYFVDLSSVGWNFLLSIMASGGLFWLWVGRYLKYQCSGCVPNTNNLADRLDFESVEFLLGAQKLSKNHRQVVDMGVLWLALNYCQAGRYFIVRCGFQSVEEYSGTLADYWKQSQEQNAWSQEIINTVARLAQESQGPINIADLISRLVESSELWQKLLATKNLNTKDAVAITSWYKKHLKLTQKVPFWEKDTVEGAVGRDWSYGYTPNLQLYARDISERVANQRPIKIYGRENEVKELEQILTKSDANNALLVGEQGVGKSTIVHSLAQKIMDGKVSNVLAHKHIWELDSGRLIAGAGEAGGIEQRLKMVLDEAVSAGNIILFIDNIQNILSVEKRAGAINAGAILLPYLKGRGLQIIGDTTLENYHKNVEANSSIASSFEKVEVDSPKKEDVVYVLEDTIPMFEYKYGVVFTFPAVKEAVQVSDRYIHDKPFPAKAIELIDNVSVAASQRGVKIITPQQVDEIASVKADVPVGEASTEEKKKLLDLENVMHRRVVGQKEAITALSSALRRARSGLQRENKPLGTFLFIGPTGVGKTETAKALAEAFFNSQEKIIRLDMSEYQGADAVNRLIGSAPVAGGDVEQGVLTKAIKDNPFSVVLLDEIEKANPNVLNLFLQVLDEGRLTDSLGRTVSFTNAIIIATSNAGAEMIRQSLLKQENYELLKKRLLEYLQTNNIFRPEFLNRFDAVIAFRPLTMDELIMIVDIMIDKVAAVLKEKNITLDVTPAAKQKLAQLGYDPVYGARPLARTIQTKLEDPLSEKLLRDEIPPDSTVTVDANDIN